MNKVLQTTWSDYFKLIKVINMEGVPQGHSGGLCGGDNCDG